MFVRRNDTVRGPAKDVPHLTEADPCNSVAVAGIFFRSIILERRQLGSLWRSRRHMVERYNGEATSAPRPTCSFIAHSLGRLERLAWATNLIEVDRPKGAGTMETMGPIPNSDSRLCAFPNVSPATHGPWAREERNGSARRRGGRGFSLAVGTMLAVLLISRVSSAETSPRGVLEDFF